MIAFESILVLLLAAMLLAAAARRMRAPLRRRAMAAARKAISAMRATDEIGDAAFHRVEEELDWVEMSRTPR